MFLGWFDDDPKKGPGEKIREAMQRYFEKFEELANVCLVNGRDRAEVQGVEVKVVEYIRPHNFWVGRVDYQEDEASA